MAQTGSAISAVTIDNATHGIDEAGLEAYRDAIKTSILTNVSQNIVDKFAYEIGPDIRKSWGSLQEGARDRFLMQMNSDIYTLKTHIDDLEKQVNAAFSDAIKEFRNYDNSFVVTRRID